MISNATAKLIQSLKHKKYRQKYNLFVAEGSKSIVPILQHKYLKIKKIWHTADALFGSDRLALELVEVDESQLSKVTHFKSTPDALALIEIPVSDFSEHDCAGPAIYLDDVQDPGNVGTILRIADWFGIKTVIRTPGTADFYGSKVVQSSMGSIGNLRLFTMDHNAFLQWPYDIVAADMSGDDRWRPETADRLCLIIGNEGAGVSDQILAKAKITCSIQGSQYRLAESLNAAVSCAILCDRFFGSKL